MNTTERTEHHLTMTTLQTVFEEVDSDTDTEEGPTVHSVVNEPNKKSDEEIWNDKTLDDKCWEVMLLLQKKERLWDKDPRYPKTAILEGYKKRGLTERDPRDTKGYSALHYIAKDGKQFEGIDEDISILVITYLLDHLEKREAQESISEAPILHVALKNNNDKFITLVMKCRPKRFPDLLDMQNKDGKNIIHCIFSLSKNALEVSDHGKKVFNLERKATLTRAAIFVSQAKPETLAARDKDGNTPIHYAMDYHQCFGRKKKYIEIVKDMVLKADDKLKGISAFNHNDESPIQYCLRTQDDRTRNLELQSSNTSTEGTVLSQDPYKTEVEGPSMRPKSTSQNLGYKAASIKEFLGDQGTSLGTSNMYGSRSTNHSALTPPEVVKVDKNNSEPSEATPSSPEDQVPSHINLMDFLKLHYIRTQTDLVARDLIYGRYMSDKNLYFDASGLTRADKIIELIDRMSFGGFYEILAYVYIPTIEHSQDTESTKKVYTMKQATMDQKTLPENTKIGRHSVVKIFEKLYQCGVRRILRLHVEDREYPSHTDAAIEKALQGRDSLSTQLEQTSPILVETWDWRKPDISIDVIAFATPEVETINLYWSGNQAVLRAWCCSEGIPRLYATNEKKLKKVIIHASPGIETSERMAKMVQRFQDEINKQMESFEATPKEAYKQTTLLNIKIIPRISGIFSKDDLIEGSNNAIGNKEEGEQQHIWIKRMEQFRAALNSIHKIFPEIKIKQPRRVKVALIDDGVDLSALDSYDGIVQATGQSYCFPDSRGENPWHRSSNGHGTIMANMIVRLNPWIYLYVMKLQDSSSADGGRSIFAESAAKAIRGAIQRNVDIISMSWTIKQKIASNRINASSTQASSQTRPAWELNGLQMLENAIDAAVNAKILMFCSASDDIQESSTECLPYGKAPDYIFRIGAALSHGQRDPYAEDKANIHYFFPGNQVAEAWNPRSAQTVKYHNGSSVSTALSAGFASLIIYCVIIMKSYYESKSNISDSNYIRFSKFAEDLRDRQMMKRAFDSIESDSWDDKKYLPVWDTFGITATNIEKAKTGEEKLMELEKLALQLCGKLNIH